MYSYHIYRVPWYSISMTVTKDIIHRLFIRIYKFIIKCYILITDYCFRLLTTLLTRGPGTILYTKLYIYIYIGGSPIKIHFMVKVEGDRYIGGPLYFKVGVGDISPVPLTVSASLLVTIGTDHYRLASEERQQFIQMTGVFRESVQYTTWQDVILCV